MDKDYAPLSAHCVRALCDKMYEKRKAAALEIEKLTKDCIHVNNQTQVQKLLRVLGTDFAMSQNPNMRKGKNATYYYLETQKTKVLMKN